MQSCMMMAVMYYICHLANLRIDSYILLRKTPKYFTLYSSMCSVFRLVKPEVLYVNQTVKQRLPLRHRTKVESQASRGRTNVKRNTRVGYLTSSSRSSAEHNIPRHCGHPAVGYKLEFSCSLHQASACLLFI